MAFLGVSAQRLHKRHFALDDGDTLQGSVFPFFNREGEVRALMIGDTERGEVYATHWREGLMRPRWFASDELHVTRGELHTVTGNDLGPLGTLWHFDPWWVLRQARFAHQDAVPLLKQTNCANELGDGSKLFFTGDVSRIRLVMRGVAGGHSWQRWKPSLLPSEQPPIRDDALQPLTRAAQLRWVLDPAWV